MTEANANPPHSDIEFAEIYGALKHIARRERQRLQGQWLDTTAIVHEAWLKLNGAPRAFSSEHHYLSTAALAMRQILTDLARQSVARKRILEKEAGRYSPGISPLFDGCGLNGASDIDVLAIDAALTQLAEIDAALVDFISLRFYAGLTLEEVARHQQICVRTASRQWQRARALLRVLMGEA